MWYLGLDLLTLSTHIRLYYSFSAVTFLFGESCSNLTPHILKQNNNCSIANWRWCETRTTSMRKCHCGGCSAPLHAATSGRRNKLQTCEGCEGFICALVLWCGEVWWGWALPTERLRRQSETAVSLVVAADRVRPLKLTHTGRKAGGGSQLLPDHSESHRHTMLLHPIEQYNMADRLGLTCMELPACYNCSVSAEPRVPSLLPANVYINQGCFADEKASW